MMVPMRCPAKQTNKNTAHQTARTRPQPLFFAPRVAEPGTRHVLERCSEKKEDPALSAFEEDSWNQRHILFRHIPKADRRQHNPAFCWGCFLEPPLSCHAVPLCHPTDNPTNDTTKPPSMPASSMCGPDRQTTKPTTHRIKQSWPQPSSSAPRPTAPPEDKRQCSAALF